MRGQLGEGGERRTVSDHIAPRLDVDQRVRHRGVELAADHLWPKVVQQIEQHPVVGAIDVDGDQIDVGRQLRRLGGQDSGKGVGGPLGCRRSSGMRITTAQT